MSLASLPSRRKDIPDSLDDVRINLDGTYVGKRNRKQFGKPQSGYRYRNDRNGMKRERLTPPSSGLLPHPTNNLLPQPHLMPSRGGPPLLDNLVPTSSGKIHVNPHFRARLPFENEFNLQRPQFSSQQFQDQRQDQPFMNRLRPQQQQPLLSSQPQPFDNARPPLIAQQPPLLNQNPNFAPPQQQQQQQQPPFQQPQQPFRPPNHFSSQVILEN